MQNKTGPPVRGTDFLKRTAETRELWHRAMRGHVLLLAPRRVGKTSLLFHLIDDPQPGWRCLFYSAESLKTEAQFVARFLRTMCEAKPGGAWMTRFSLGLRQMLEGFGQIEAGPFEFNLAQALHSDWRGVGETALKIMRELQGNTLILVDEFPTFVQNLLHDPEDGARRARHFLDWFRESRNPPGQDGAMVYFVLTGSLSLEAVVRAASMTSTINDLSVFRLGPLTADLPARLLEGLSQGEQLPLSEPVKQRILERIDWPIPFHLQLLFGEVLTRVKFRDRPLTPSLVDEAYEALLGTENNKHFQHWVDRFEAPQMEPQDRSLKKALLRAACRDPKGISMSTALQIQRKAAPDLDAGSALLSLDHDGYLTLHEGRWLFASSLLREWWSKWQKNQKT